MDKIIAQHRHQQSASGYSMYQMENMDLDSRMLSSSSNESSSSTSFRKSAVLHAPSSMTRSVTSIDLSRRQEDRLMRNRSAAKECRLKKKEYVKCLEKRLKVLEDQNKQLIDQVKYLLHIVRTNSMTAGGPSATSNNDTENTLSK